MAGTLPSPHVFRQHAKLSQHHKLQLSPAFRAGARRSISRYTSRSFAAQAGNGNGANRSRVTVIGESLFDLIADQRGPRETVKSWTPFAGGAACNVATSIGKLGMDVVFITALGKDERGDQLQELIKKCGIKTHGIQRRDEPTRDVYVVQNEKGDREFSGFGMPTDRYCDAFLDASQMPIDDIKSSALLVTGTLALAQPKTRETIMKAVQVAKEGGCRVLVDVNWRSVFWEDHNEARRIINEYLQQADLLKLSDADLEWLLGMDLTTSLLNPCKVAEAFPKAQGVLVTAGDEGAAYCFHSAAKGENAGFIPCFSVQVAETTGAGDAFTAGFVYKLLQAGSLEALAADASKLKEAVTFGSAAGALTCTKKGAIDGQPTLDEVMQLYDKAQQQVKPAA